MNKYRDSCGECQRKLEEDTDRYIFSTINGRINVMNGLTQYPVLVIPDKDKNSKLECNSVKKYYEQNKEFDLRFYENDRYQGNLYKCVLIKMQ